MRKIKEVLRLRFAAGLDQDQIARSCSIGQSTVHRYLKKAAAAGLQWPLPEEYDDRQLNQLLFPAAPDRSPPTRRAGIDFTQVHRELKTHRHLTLQLIWEEYRQNQPDGYRYSRFCELYQRWSRNHDVVMRQDHLPGEKMFVDWAGPTVPIYDRQTGETAPASLFVAVLGASTYTFARAAMGQSLPHWIDCHVRAFEFFDGTTKLIVPDNPRTGVDRACRYEPDINRTYHEMSQHYGTAVMPARPYKPRDKAKVENAVLVAERWILAALRRHKFFALAELQDAIAPLLERLNHRPFRKREGTRAALYASEDRPALRALPAERYVIADWKTVRASIDYHVEIDRHYYSVPYQLAGQQLEARFTLTTVEIFDAGKRIASHVRGSVPYRHTTVPAHMPKSHQAHLEWTPSRLIHWGQQRSERPPPRWSARFWKAGPTRKWAIAPVSESCVWPRPTPASGWRPPVSAPSNSRPVPIRVSVPCSNGHSISRPRWTSNRNGPARAMKTSAAPATTIRPTPSNLPNQRKAIRMLNQPTIEKLHTMKLHGMADAFRAQLETTDMSQLSFEERFGMVVDQQWLWKENRALARRLRSAKLKQRGLIEDIDYQHSRGLDRKLTRTLSSSEWVRQKQNIVLTGPTGIGKSWLGCALAQKACRDGYSLLHKSMNELFRELAVAHADGSIGRMLVKLSRVDVLLLDDFAMAPMKDSERRNFLEICDDRYQRRSMILTSQMPVAHWHEQIGDPTIADSILDRLAHNAYRLELNGESVRKKRARKPEENNQ